MLVLKPPAVCILYWQWISVIGPYQIMHLSLNFTFAFKSEERNEHCWLKIREAGPTVIKHHCDQSGDRAEGVSAQLWGPPWQKDSRYHMTKRRPFGPGENAELKNTAVFEREIGLEGMGALTGCNYTPISLCLYSLFSLSRSQDISLSLSISCTLSLCP